MFLVHAATGASWGPRVPAIKERLGIDDSHLAVALGALAVAMFAGTRLAPWLRDRVGGRRLVRGAAVVLTLSLLGPAAAGSFGALVVGLAVMGLAIGVLDVAMNAEAVAYERAAGRPIMAGLHGCWSAGMLVGGGTAAVAALLSVGATAHLAAAAIVLAVVVVAVTRNLPAGDELGDRAEVGDELESASGRASAGGAVRAIVVLGIVAACAFALEGAMADWSAVYLHDHLDASPGVAATGFVAFAVGMTVSRFVADRVVTRFGPGVVVRAAGVGGALGLLLVVAVPIVPLAIAGFFLVGVSFAPVVPVAFRAAGQGIGGHHRLAWVVTIGYLGTVAGPIIIGSVTTAAGLRAGLAVLVLVGAAVAVAAPATASPAE